MINLFASFWRWLSQAVIEFIETLLSWPESMFAPSDEDTDDDA